MLWKWDNVMVIKRNEVEHTLTRQPMRSTSRRPVQPCHKLVVLYCPANCPAVTPRCALCHTWTVGTPREYPRRPGVQVLRVSCISIVPK